MAHGGGGEGGENGERWLVSYADFITLLMVLFVVLYSMGQVDVQKYKQLAESMRAAFSLGGASKVVDATINSTGGTMENGQPNPIVVPGIPDAPPKSEEVAGQLTQMLSSSGLGNQVSVQTNVEGVLISLSEKLVFKPGSLELPQEAYQVLDAIIKMIQPIDNPIRLVGHTDDTPAPSPYKNNMEFSAARASVIADYLISKGIDPSRITISGRGEYDALFPNDTDEHRSLNGRVDIVVIYKVDQSVIGDQGLKVAP
jgi:chemotaxis protein MotB